jgi:hypothetical protein
MTLGSATQAVREAQRLFGLSPNEEGTAFPIQRLDKLGSAYFLIHIADRVVCLDAATGALMASATIPRPPLLLPREAAIQSAHLSPTATAELVWAPSAATHSMFDPLWAVIEGEQTCYVDQRGKLWDTLPLKRPGGGPG